MNPNPLYYVMPDLEDLPDQARQIHEELRQQKESANQLGPNGEVPHPEFPPYEDRPCFKVYDKAFLAKKKLWEPGVYHHGIQEVKDNRTGQTKEIPIDVRILSYLNVLGIVHTEECKEHSYLIDYASQGETVLHRDVFPQSLLVGRVEELMKTLRGLGVTALHEHRELIRSFLDREHLRFSKSDPETFWTSVKTIGWHDNATFVLPSGVIGKRSGFWYSGNAKTANYGTNGDLQKWKDQVATPCAGNPYLVFTLSASFAGTLLERLNTPGIGFQISGDSTTGKTTGLLVAASSWGSPKFVLSWRSTTNGLESTASTRSDTITLLDESHLIDPKQLDGSVYMLANGESKQRMNRDTTPKDVIHWRNCILSTGERSIGSHLTSADIDHKAGQGVRIVDIDIAHGSTFGIFDELHGAHDGNAFSTQLRNAAAQNYGFAGPAFVQWLIDNPGLDIRARLDRILADIGGAGLNAQDSRVARSFAQVALAGELAIEANILPWEKESVIASVKTIFTRWLESQPKNTKSTEDSQILDNIANFIARHGDTRFTDIDDKSEKTTAYNRAGYFENEDGQRYFLFNKDGLKEAAKGYSPIRIGSALQQAEAFWKVGPKEKAILRRVPGRGPMRLYHVNPQKLDL